MATVAEKLAGVQAAIDAIEGGAQEYRIGTRTVRRGDLSALYTERRQLEREAGAAYTTSVAYFDRR